MKPPRKPNRAPSRVLFVCLGNICRSPLAEGVFRHLVAAAELTDDFEIDSAGTGAWHVGEPPDPRSVAVGRTHGVHLAGRARQVRADDFEEFDVVVAMDRSNLENLAHLSGRPAPSGDDVPDLSRSGGAGERAHLLLLRALDPEAESDLDVPDPYYGGPDGFEDVYRMILRSCESLLQELAPGAPKPDSP